jgi:hypothetical protein
VFLTSLNQERIFKTSFNHYCMGVSDTPNNPANASPSQQLISIFPLFLGGHSGGNMTKTWRFLCDKNDVDRKNLGDKWMGV